MGCLELGEPPGRASPTLASLLKPAASAPGFPRCHMGPWGPVSSQGSLARDQELLGSPVPLAKTLHPSWSVMSRA